MNYSDLCESCGYATSSYRCTCRPKYLPRPTPADRSWENDDRKRECSQCDGEGGWYYASQYDVDDRARMHECGTCEGRGWVWERGYSDEDGEDVEAANEADRYHDEAQGDAAE